MTISYPLTLPSGFDSYTLGFSSAIVRSLSPMSLQGQTVDWGGRSWWVELHYPDLKAGNPKTRALQGFIAALQGGVGTFLFGDPLLPTPAGVATGSPLIAGADQVGAAVLTDGWTPSVTGILKCGDYIQIGQRLHMVLADANSDGAGAATLDIMPPLYESPADNSTVITSSPQGLFRLGDPDQSWSVDKERTYSFHLRAVDAK